MKNDPRDAQLDAAIKELPEAIMPEKDLWQGIENAIEMRTEKRTPYYMYAASFCMVCSLVFVGWSVSNTQKDNAETSSMASITLDMERGFEMQKASLLANVKGESALVHNLNQQLEELELARNTIKDALKDDPDNFYLVNILKNIHQQQISLIESAYQKSWQSI